MMITDAMVSDAVGTCAILATIAEAAEQAEVSANVIEIYAYDDNSGQDCPFQRETESFRVARPDACDHPANETHDCTLEPKIPDHCPLRKKPLIVRIKAGE
jgi:hypothetical protein